jgi:predicted nuclease of restriction endonuclease-like (RecB) superfamily
LFPDILQAVGAKYPILTWTHYRALLRVIDDEARNWHTEESLRNTWSARTLERNISTQYYYRMLKTSNPDVVESEMKSLTKNYQADKLEFIKNPVVVEFLGISPEDK